MILDDTVLFSDSQDLSQVAGAYASTNVIDLGADRDIGLGNPVRILVQVDETFASAGAATLNIDLETDDNSSFSSATTIATTGAVAKATLVQGYKFAEISFVPRANERYLRLNYTIGTATTTAGTVTAGIVFEDQSAKSTFPTA